MGLRLVRLGSRRELWLDRVRGDECEVDDTARRLRPLLLLEVGTRSNARVPQPIHS